MKENAAGAPGQEHTMRIAHGAVVTTRMPTAEERACGYPAGSPVLVVAHGARCNVYPIWVTLEFDDPHGQPPPDALRDAVGYVLGVVREELGLAAGRLDNLAVAALRSPCSVTHLADEIREERAADWLCADVGAPMSPEAADPAQMIAAGG